MKHPTNHSWNLSPGEARLLQERLAPLVDQTDWLVEPPRLIAGVDVSGPALDGRVRAAVVILAYPEMETEEVVVVEDTPLMPYVPGLLSFRECPLLLTAFDRLQARPQLVLVDGHGVAHPRRFGIAAHLGVLLDVPTIGCAKSLLCGRYDNLAQDAGSTAPVIHRGDIVGMAVRTRDAISPVFVSTGHKVSLPGAVRWVLGCTRGRRIPEPTRRAHLAAADRLKPARAA